MRPELSALNASLAYQRREKQRHEEECWKETRDAYNRGYHSAKSRYVSKLYGCQYTMRSVDMLLPFEERMKIAKENLAIVLARKIINDIDIDHEKLPFDGEVWTARIPIGKIERVVVADAYTGGVRWI